MLRPESFGGRLTTIAAAAVAAGSLVACGRVSVPKFAKEPVCLTAALEQTDDWELFKIVPVLKGAIPASSLVSSYLYIEQPIPNSPKSYWEVDGPAQKGAGYLVAAMVSSRKPVELVVVVAGNESSPSLGWITCPPINLGERVDRMTWDPPHLP